MNKLSKNDYKYNNSMSDYEYNKSMSEYEYNKSMSEYEYNSMSDYEYNSMSDYEYNSMSDYEYNKSMSNCSYNELSRKDCMVAKFTYMVVFIVIIDIVSFLFYQ